MERHPGRVRAVDVHDVSPDERDDEVRRIARELDERGDPMLRMENTLRAAEHARDQGQISAGAVDAVRADVERQEEPSPE